MLPLLGGHKPNSKKAHPLEDKYINIDVYLRICVLEFVKVRLQQAD